MGAAAVIAALAATGVALLPSSCRREPSRPNILIVSIDTLNRSALRVYDPAAEELPHIERFAAESCVLERAYSTSPWTLPAHASLLTGLYPARHGATHEELRIDSSVSTLAGVLAEAGYETVGFTDGGYVDAVYGFGAGFDRYNDEVARDRTGAIARESAGSIELPRNGQYADVAGTAMFDRLIAFLKARKSDKPLFAFAQTFAVHEYYNVNPWAAARLPGREFAKPAHYMAVLDGNRQARPGDWDALRDLYRAELHHLDESFGRLLAAVDEAGLRANTIVLFVSDHGEGFDPEQGRIHHGGRLHTDLISVPLIVRGPGIAPRRSAEPVSLVDVMPTILESAQLAPAPSLDGRSFASVLAGTGTLGERTLYAEEYFYDWRNGRRRRAKEVKSSPISIAVISGDHWYIQGPRKSEELYRAGSDPLQKQSVAQDSPDITRLRELWGARASLQAPTQRVARDDATIERLRKLGYVDR